MYQQITDNKSYILPCLTQITANHRKQIVYLAMPPQKPPNYRQSYISSCLTQIPINHRQQITRLANASHRYLQITGAKNRSSRMINHKSRIVHLAMHQQITGNKSYIISCLTQIPANQRQQIVHLAMPFTDTSDRRQQIVYLTMPHTDTSKSQTTNRTSCHASHRCQRITTTNQPPLNHGQQIVHLVMPHTDANKSQATNRLSCHASTHTNKSQATNRVSCHASHRYQQMKDNKLYN